ncbi:zinc finger protein 11-like [Salvelinus fontinalis]|uniref:zinc finger protein 11-like n=1 Tax=Salvelinus fontinalis TaxID=8038 RepID=UPI002485088F|nr:zinc finger protein 11-like [Salvelinus fontinalis]
MERRIHGGKGPPLPLPSLRLMVPPLRLVSAAIWQTIQQRHVMDYGMLEEFVTMVTEMVPELLNLRQRAQLILGLRARLVLELCRSKPITDLQTIQPHLDRIQTLTPLWGTQATDAEVGLSESNFLGLVQTLLKDPDEREHFFQDVFPVEFGPSYDAAIQNLMWQFLSRLEKLLPMSNFQQASSLLGDVPSVLEECVESVSHPQQLKTLLQYHRDLGQLDNHDPPSSTDGDCILSALCLPPVERVVIATEVEKEGKSMDVKEREEGVDSRSGECEKNKISSVNDEEAEDDAEFADQVTERDPEYETVMVIGEDGIEKPFKLLKKHPQKKEETHGEQCRTTVKPGQKISIGVSKAIMSSMIQKPSVDLQGVVIANVTQTPKSSQTVGRAKRSLERRTCKVCGKVVQRPAVLRKHMVTHTGDWPYQCPTCKKIYKTLGSFQEHTEKCVFPIEEMPEESEPSISVMQYKGLMLKKILPRPPGQKVAQSEKKQKRIVCKTCPVCGKTLATSSSMKRHQIIHTEPKKCRVCEQVFPNPSELKIHMESHPKKGIHQCSNCERTFKHDYSVKAHEEACLFLSHQQGELGESSGLPATGQTDPGPSGSTHQQSVTCEAEILQLSATLSKQNSAFTYMHSVEGSSARAKRSLERRTCKVCGKVVQRPAVLRKHMVTHTGDWPYRCPTCKKIYKTLRSFQKHIERCVFPIEETPKDSESSSTNATESSSPEPSAPIGSSKRCARCPICHKFILGYLRYHILSHSDERPHACPRCGSKYKFDFVLRRHMRLFCKVKKGEPVELGGKKVHKCIECGKEFGLKSTLTAHKRIHNPLRCAYCRRMFPDQETLAIHKVEHKPVQCTMCEKSFNVIRYLSRHYVDDHQFSGPFRCTYCERSYADLAALIRHQRIHTGGEPPYKCSHCPKKFHFETALVTHQRNHTGEKPCLCWECGKTFQSKGILKSHMNRVHTPQVKRIPCSQCNKVFRDKGQMKMHENVYHKGVRYPCSYCGKGFYSPAPLARHVLIHTGENPYSCTYKECTRVFKSASELRIHMRYHTGERPFKCKDCGKGFVQAHYLTIHRRSHTGEKPYPCLTCDKSFGTSHQLSRHMKTHTGEKPYQCMDCGKAFNRRDRLRTHQDKCHPAY